MLRVLMVLEDYSELVYLQSLLKKLGFDVEAIQNPKGFQDGLLKMNPDLLVMNGLGKIVRGQQLASTLRRPRASKVILTAATGAAGAPGADVDAWIESPVVPQKFLEVVARVCGLDGEILAEKFRKMQEKEEAERTRELKMKAIDSTTMERGRDEATPAGGLEASKVSAEERALRYQNFLKSAEIPPEHTFGARQVAAQVRELRKTEGDSSDLERERREFVQHLFKAKR